MILSERGGGTVNKPTRQTWDGFFSTAVFALGLTLAAVEPAGSTSKAGPSLDPVRLTCKITGPAAAGFGLSDHVLCDEARLAIQELADGQIDRNVAQLEGWSTFANPNKEKVLQECQQQGGPVGGCDEDNYDLLYRGQQVPITEINANDIRPVESEGLTVIVDGSVETSTMTLSVSIIEPTFGTVPQPQVKLPIIELQKSRVQSLREALKLDLARYFVPEKLNAIIAVEVARSKH
jgi:hypothetical protein